MHGYPRCTIYMNLITPILSLFILNFIIFLIILDFRKSRKKSKKPLITFLVPCYNGEKTLKCCIESIYNSYNPNKIELFVIDDHSIDNTTNILKILQKQFKFKIITNNRNLGKTKSINSTWRKAKGELIWIVDADIILNKVSVNECLKRLYSNDKIGAISCKYKVIKKSLLSWMVGLEYNMMSFVNSAYNMFPKGAFLIGGCSVYRKKAFLDINGLKNNMISEDMDSGLRLWKKGWKVEQSFNPILTYSPETIKKWLSQKIRWSAGGMQCFLSNPYLFIKNPLTILFVLIYSIGALLGAIEVTSLPFLNISYFVSILLLFLINLPYIILEIDSFKEIKKLYYLFPFVIIYYPIFLIISVFGFFKGFFSYFTLNKSRRGW